MRGRDSEFGRHTPVLVDEVLELLAPAVGQTIVDCTVGFGGHSLAILPKLMPIPPSAGPRQEAVAGRVIAIDRDEQALELARTRLVEFAPQIEYVHGVFGDLPEILQRLNVGRVHGLVADLGISSLHVDQAERGFSFLREGPLDMRMDRTQSTTAASLIRELSEEELADVLYRYGEERLSRRIARRIVETQQVEPIETTTQLARVVASAVPSGRSRRRIHPATRTFQALRIAVNQELSQVETLLRILPDLLLPGGRAVIMAFHSLEDRLVKRAFLQGAKEGVFRPLTKKPLQSSDQEVDRNPRSRSAKLRAVERMA